MRMRIRDPGIFSTQDSRWKIGSWIRDRHSGSATLIYYWLIDAWKWSTGTLLFSRSTYQQAQHRNLLLCPRSQSPRTPKRKKCLKIRLTSILSWGAPRWTALIRTAAVTSPGMNKPLRLLLAGTVCNLRRIGLVLSSVADPWQFGPDPDPRIRASD